MFEIIRTEWKSLKRRDIVTKSVLIVLFQRSPPAARGAYTIDIVQRHKKFWLKF